MKTQKAITTYGLAACATAALLATQAGAAPINYSETFDTTGAQADENGEAFAASAYTGWTFNASPENTSQAFATVSNTTAKELSMVSGAGHAGVISAVVSATQIAGTSTIDISTNALTVTTDFGDRFPDDSPSSGNRNAGLVIGDVVIAATLGRSPETVYRVTNFGHTTQLKAFEGIGFIAPEGVDGSDTIFSTMSVSVIENGANYDYTLSISNGTNVFNDTFSIAKTTAGDIDQIGFSVQTFSSGGANYSTSSSFDNLTVTQIPEPGSLALIALGGLCVLRRRRA